MVREGWFRGALIGPGTAPSGLERMLRIPRQGLHPARSDVVWDQTGPLPVSGFGPSRHRLAGESVAGALRLLVGSWRGFAEAPLTVESRSAEVEE